jgi:thioredoxin-dependent peroxiredoxin
MRVLQKLTVSVAVVALATAASATVALKVGDVAPTLSLQGSDGKQYSLASYKGKQVVVLAWFAKAFTGP